MLQQHPKDLPVWMVRRVEQSLLLEILQNKIADIETEPFIHRGKATLLEIVQPHIIGDTADRQRAVGDETRFRVGNFLTQAREQPVQVKESQVRRFAFVSL